MFYLSAYLEEHRDNYYQALRNISQQRDWNTWLAFFLQAIEYQANENASRVRKIHLLYDEMKERIRAVSHSQYTIQALDGLFDRPIFQTSDFVKRTGIPKQTAMPMLRQIKDAGILTTLREASGRRSTIYAFKSLLNTAEGKEIV
jgi:Fic family protein